MMGSLTLNKFLVEFHYAVRVKASFSIGVWMILHRLNIRKVMFMYLKCDGKHAQNSPL